MNHWFRNLINSVRRLYVEVFYGKILNCELYLVEDVEHRVIWIKGSESGLRGSTTIFNNILLNTAALNHYSNDMEQRVFLHEAGHVHQNILLSWSLIILRIFLLVISMIFGLVLLSTPIFGGQNQFILSTLSLTGLLFAIWSLTKVWTYSELKAEIFCVEYMGEEKFRKCTEKFRQNSHYGPLWSTVRPYLYPSPDEVLRAVGTHSDS